MNLSIRTRLILVITSITLGCVVLGFTAVGVRQIDGLRAQRLEAMDVLADVTGDSTVSALAFGDAEDAGTVLGRLAEFADIEAAALYDGDGRRFATYQRKGKAAAVWPDVLPGDAPRVREIRDRVARVRVPVIYEDQRYGTIELIASNAALRAEIDGFVRTLAVIAAVLIAASVVAAWLLARRISRPVLALADVARRITGGQDMGLRAPTGASGELGVLADGFNAMLAKLAAREKDVIASRDTLRAVIDASPVAIVGVDAAGAVTLWSARAAAVLGVPEADAIGRPITLVAPDPALATVWARCATVPLVAVEIDLRERALAFSTAPLPAGGAVIMAADITERRRAAEALAERATQLQRAQKMDVVGRLAGGVAHDFNNLLTVVQASAQMVRTRVPNRPDLAGYIDSIQSAAQRGSALSRRLLGFSRRQAVDEKTVDLHAVLADLEKMVRSVVGENVLVELDLAESASTAHLDQGQLEQVLLNLVLNARDAMPGGGVLTLGTRVVDGADPTAPRRSPTGVWTAVSVQDTGTGMSRETRARLFEPFFTTKSNGTGLGLATAQQITRDLGGEITVDSQPGIGTTFTVWLPQTGVSAGRPVADPAGPTAVGSDTVLLVEDEVALRNLVQILLAEAGYHVLVAASSREALALGSAAGVQIDLLVTDVVMPGLSGPQLAGELLRRRPELQVLYMSGYVGDALTEQGLDEGANLIHKPFKPEQLLRLIRDMLDARPRRHRRASELALAPEPGTA